MKSFLIRFFMLTTVLLFGVLFGIYQTHHGLFSTNEKSDQQVQTKQEEQTEQVVSKDAQLKQTNKKDDKREQQLINKQEKAATASAINFYSDLGAKIGDIFQHLFSTVIFTLTEAIDSYINSR